MINFLRLAVIVSIAAWLAGCQNIFLAQKKATGLDAYYWEASGKVSVTIDPQIYPQSETRQQTLQFSWLQTGDDFLIELSGNFGFGKTNIRKAGDLVYVERGGEILDSADNPNLLLEQTTGLYLPVSGMRFWILGLASDQSDTAQLNTVAGLGCIDTDNCAIEGFNDDSWSIAFPRVQMIENGEAGEPTDSANHYILPKRLTASTDGISLNTAITSWKSSMPAKR